MMKEWSLNKIGYPHRKTINLGSYFIKYTDINSKYVVFNVKSKVLNLPMITLNNNFMICDRQRFLTQRHKTITLWKTINRTKLKLRASLHQRHHYENKKATMWEKIFVIHIKNTQRIKINKKKRDNPIEKQARNNTPQRVESSMSNKYFKICTTSLVIREMWNIITMKYYCCPSQWLQWWRLTIWG